MATESSHRDAPSGIFNVPNQLTSARLVLSVVLFVFLAVGYYRVSLLLFVLAAATDWVDGYWARKYGQVTVLGRILDPFADKIIVCGTYIFLVAVPQSEVHAWMAVVIVGRELLVTALRSAVEERGGDFSARTAGKWKMVVQCVAAAVCLFRLTYLDSSGASATWTAGPPTYLTWLVIGLVWSAVIITVYSAMGYVLAAIRLLRP